MKIGTPYIKEYIQRDGNKYYTAHIKTFLGNKALNCDRHKDETLFCYFRSGEFGNYPHEFISESEAKKALEDEIRRGKLLKEKEINEEVVKINIIKI